MRFLRADFLSRVLGKNIYQRTCDEQNPWDTDVPQTLRNKFEQWVNVMSITKPEILHSVSLRQVALSV